MFKNVASQKIALFAFDTTTGAAKTGDAANITAYVAKDYGATTVLTDTTATEQDATNAPGWYVFDVAQAETNGDALLFTGKSATTNIAVVGQLLQTVPASFSSLPTATQVADAVLTRDWTAVSGEAARSVLNALRFLRNKWALSGTTLSVKKEDDSTEAWNAATTNTAGADPVTGVDPT